MANKFPCPYCKGKFSWIEPVLDDGSGPEYTCGFCDEGMIEVGGAKHLEIKRQNPPKDFMWEWIGELGSAIDQVIDALEKLPSDGWSDGPHLLQICRKAKQFHYEP